MANAVGESDEEGDPDGTRDARSVLDVQASEVVDDAANGAVLGQGEFRLPGHGFKCCLCLCLCSLQCLARGSSCPARHLSSMARRIGWPRIAAAGLGYRGRELTAIELRSLYGGDGSWIESNMMYAVRMFLGVCSCFFHQSSCWLVVMSDGDDIKIPMAELLEITIRPESGDASTGLGLA